MKNKLEEFDEYLKGYSDNLKELSKRYQESVTQFLEMRDQMSKKDREGFGNEIKAQKEEYDKARKNYDDFFSSVEEAKKKHVIEELASSKQYQKDQNAVDQDQIENRKDSYSILVELKNKYAKDIKGMDEQIAASYKSFDPKGAAAEDKAKELKAYTDKWGGIAKKTAEYTTLVNNSLTSMFGATTKYLEKEKELMTKELAAINEKLEGAKKETAKAAQEFANVKAKAQEEIDKKFAIKHTDTDEEKDKKEADREAAYTEIEELQALYDKRQEMADKNAEHEGEIDYQAQQLSVEEVNRFNELSATHDGYVASLDQKMKAQKDVQKTEADLQKEATDKQAEIDKKEKQKQRVEMSQQMIAASVNIAQGITKALAMGPIIGPIMAGVVGAAGAVQIGMMSAQMAKMRLEDGGLLSGKRHSAGGMRIQGSNIEVEGGEYVVNRQSTNKNLGLIDYINSQRRQLAPSDLDSFFTQSSQGFEPPFRQAFAQGGQLPNIEPTTNIDNQLLVQAIQGIKFEPKVSVTDINTVQSDIVKVDAWTGM